MLFLIHIFSIEVTPDTPSIQIASFSTAANDSQYIHRDKQEDLRRRRLARYSAAEQALAESFKIQQLPQELHLEAFKKAISILDGLVADTRDAVDRLRALLANRSVEPTLYRSIQRQRWMEEKRLVVFDQLSKTLRIESTRSSTSMNIGQTLTLGTSNSKSNTNLVKFFESSRRRTPIRSRTRRRMPLLPKLLDQQTGDFHMEFPRRHNENYIIPLMLKPPQPRRIFPLHTPQYPQDFPTSFPSVKNATSTSSTTSSNASNIETIAEDNDIISHNSLPINYNQDETDGTALIWRDVPRSKEEILGQLHITMPDYVTNLLADFDSTCPDPIVLPPHTRFRLDTTPPSTPRKPVRKSPSRHRLSTLFSGIPETFTSRLASTNGSDTTKASRPMLGTQPTTGSSIEGPFTIALSGLNLGNSNSQAPDTEEEKMVVRIRRRISHLGRF